MEFERTSPTPPNPTLLFDSNSNHTYTKFKSHASKTHLPQVSLALPLLPCKSESKLLQKPTPLWASDLNSKWSSTFNHPIERESLRDFHLFLEIFVERELGKMSWVKLWAESLYELKFKHCVWLPRKFKKILDLKPINQRLAKPNDMKPPNPNLHRSACPSETHRKSKI